MKIVFANYFFDPKLNSEMDLLRQYYTVVGWAEALQKLGCEVTVVSRFNKDSEIQINHVKYIFVRDGLPPAIKSWQIPRRFLKIVASLHPEIVHLHHLSLSLQTIALRRLLPKHTAIFIQHHGGRMVRNWKMKIHNNLHKVADGYFFTTREQGEWWFSSNRQRSKIMPVMEGGSFFNFDDRDAGMDYMYADRKMFRQKTMISGNPVFLWVGRLDENKDPLTVLNGFESFQRQHQEARLYMIFNEYHLLNEVKERISSSPALNQSVHLLGAISHHDIQAYYNSADYFVLGSHYEGSGYALSEALRCGCVPVVTNIPSFKMMTNDGRLGALWQPGDADSFLHALNKAITKPLSEEGKNCIDYYFAKLSFDAIAQTALAHYRLAIANRASQTN